MHLADTAVGMGAVAVDMVYMVNELPEADGLCRILSTQVSDGGGCGNALVQLSRLGAPTAVLGQVGDDDAGNRIRRSLEEAGVDTSWLLTRTSGTSMVTHVYLDSVGRKMIALDLGDSLLTVDLHKLDVDEISRAKLFYTTMFPPDPALAVARALRARGGNVVFNLQGGTRLMEAVGATRDMIAEMIALSDLVSLGRVSAANLLGTDDPSDVFCRIRRDYGCRGTVVFTLGSSGSIVNSRGATWEIPAFPVKAVDTTGAGDSFTAAFAYACYYLNMSPEAAGRFASAASAITCTKMGARSSPDLAKIRLLLEGGGAR